jgi:hypothetical protein
MGDALGAEEQVLEFARHHADVISYQGELALGLLEGIQ